MAAFVPPKVTAVAPVKLVPLIITEVPLPPVFGENEPIVGAAAKVKVPVDVATPLGVVTLITPVEPVPTTAVICVAD